MLSFAFLATWGATFTQHAIAAESDNIENSNNQVSIDDETLIYRKSVKGKCKEYAVASTCWDFIYALTAYKNGHIHIDIQCESSNFVNCGKIGDFQFNDTMIAAVGENGYAGKSSFDNHKLTDSKYTTSFSDKDPSLIVYTSIFYNNSISYASVILMSFDLYVKEPYLSTNQPMVLFGEEIEIPYGEPLNKDARIKELETKLRSLEQRITNMQDNISKLDANGDGYVDAVDASILLRIYAHNSTNNTPINYISEYNSMIKNE